jgi:hypothetical protein
MDLVMIRETLVLPKSGLPIIHFSKSLASEMPNDSFSTRVKSGFLWIWKFKSLSKISNKTYISKIKTIGMIA